MLRNDVMEAVEQGRFHIYPVNTIEEAIHILTGVKAGVRGKNGKFTAGSVYRKADERLAELAVLAAKAECKTS